MSALTQLGYFRTTGHHHLVVGHTHEDVGPSYCLAIAESMIQYNIKININMNILSCNQDATLSLVTEALSNETDVQTPRDIARSLETKESIVGLLH